MSEIRQRFMLLLLKQMHLVTVHQQLAEENKPNQLIDMAEGLVSLTAAIGNANGVEICNISEDYINTFLKQVFLEQTPVLSEDPKEYNADNVA